MTRLVVKYLNKKKVKLETTGAMLRFTSEPEDKERKSQCFVDKLDNQLVEPYPGEVLTRLGVPGQGC